MRIPLLGGLFALLMLSLLVRAETTTFDPAKMVSAFLGVATVSDCQAVALESVA